MALLCVGVCVKDRERDKKGHGKRKIAHCLHLNDVPSEYVCFSTNATKNSSSAALNGED